ncbi:MAG: hypothetical protein IPN42_02555 [Methylococcaceae bacterium]|nr:hypothetical protein [Methylococcaceae bacterium]
MRIQRSQIRFKRKKRCGLDDEQISATPAEQSDMESSEKHLGGFYSTGPVLHLDERHNKASAPDKHSGSMSEQGNTRAVEPTTLPTVHGTGQTRHVSAHGQSLRLEGRTDASYDGGSFRTENVTVQRSKGCTSCGGADCRHVTGTLVATYSVATTVTLPSIADFSDLRPCQRTRVQNAITNILAPHEQQHVSAFNQYNGTTRRHFDLTLCRSDFDSAIRAIFDAEEQARRSRVQAASDALDPFHFDVDLNCEDRPNRQPGTRQAQGAEANPDDSEIP